jgi:hypothetical protein
MHPSAGRLMLCACAVVAACAGGAPAPAPPPADAATSADATADATGDAAPAADATGDAAPAADATGDAAPAADATGDAAPPAAWPAISDYGARGPYPVTRQSNTGPGGGYDIFRPATLGQPGPRHPIISWANGTLFGLADYQMLLEHWASHGFVVIAARTNSTAGGGTHKAGIDWLVAENGRAGSAFQGMLDTGKIAAAGHSQGGGATIAAGSNKPGPTGLTTTLPLMPILSFESDKSVTDRQLVPMLNINASMDDRDPSGAIARQIYDGNPGTTAPLVQTAYGGVHEDAMKPAMWRPTLAWFRWQLMGDTAARALFYPAGTCGLCVDSAWKGVRHRP